MTEQVIREFHRLYYERGIGSVDRRGLHSQTNYHGIETHQCPLDLWVFQEILSEVRPALVIELGTYLGGTTLFLAHQLELLGHGQVITVDCETRPCPEHARIRYLRGQTTEPSLVAAVRDVAQTCGGPVVVIHDADHHYEPALADLETYAPFVTPGSYLIVEDTNVNGHPVLASWGPGPFEAVETFLKRHPEFQVDPSREKFLMTYCPNGYLKRHVGM